MDGLLTLKKFLRISPSVISAATACCRISAVCVLCVTLVADMAVYLSLWFPALYRAPLMSIAIAIWIRIIPIVGIMFLLGIFRACSRKYIQFIAALFFSVNLIIGILLNAYHLYTEFPLDPFLVFFNIADVPYAFPLLIPHARSLFTFLVVIAVFVFFGFRETLGFSSRLTRMSLSIPRMKHAFVFIFAATLGIHIGAPNEKKVLVSAFFTEGHKISQLYQRYFGISLAKNKTNGATSTALLTESRNLFFVQLESINAELVNTRTTPYLASLAAAHGILFPRIQGSAIQTIRAQEVILCSLLPTLRYPLAHSPRLLDDLVCLPEILKKHGYKTLFFHSLPSLDFAATGTFMKGIGFDEVHAKDIMEPGDKRLPWGFREDIFYERVFKYLKKFEGEKLFVYIAVSSSNHFPFSENTDSSPLKKLPFSDPSDLAERAANTTFIQDHFFGQMYERLFEKTYAKNSHLFVFGDHSWPMGIQDGNIINERGAWQENFVTSLAVLPAENSPGARVRGRNVTALYSDLDYLPAALELVGIKGYRFSGKSFAKEFLPSGAAPDEKRCLISLQPYSGGKIALIQYPQKYIFDIMENAVTEALLTASLIETLRHDKELSTQTHQEIRGNEKVKHVRTVTPQDLEVLSRCLEEATR